MNTAQAADGLGRLLLRLLSPAHQSRALLRYVFCVLQSGNLLPTFFALRTCRTSNPALNFPPTQIHRAELRSRPDSLFSVELQNRSQVSIPLARTQTPVLSYSLRRTFTDCSFSLVPIFFVVCPFSKTATQKPIPSLHNPTPAFPQHDPFQPFRKRLSSTRRHAPASRIHKRALTLLRPFRTDII